MILMRLFIKVVHLFDIRPDRYIPNKIQITWFNDIIHVYYYEEKIVIKVFLNEKGSIYINPKET